MTAYLQRVPNLRAQDWPKFTISLMRNDIISSLAFKRICCILLRTWAEWCLDSRATCHIGIKSTTFEAKKRKGQRKKGRGEEEARSSWKQKKKSMPYFWFMEGALVVRTLSRTYLVFPNWKHSVKRYICLPQRQTRHARATFAGQTLSPGKPRRSSVTSAPEGEGTYTCLIGLYLSTNGLFGTVIDVAVIYVFSWIWPHPLACNGSGL